MRIVMWIAEILLAVWFFGCICTYQWGSRILVEGLGVKSPEFGMFFMYGAGVFLFAAVPAVGKWWLLAVLAAWLVIQFFTIRCSGLRRRSSRATMRASGTRYT